jgi:hypothetical protein
LITGRLRRKSVSETVAEIEIRGGEQGTDRRVRFSFAKARVADVGAFAAEKVAAVLQVPINAAVAELWQTPKPPDWESLTLAATCWERQDYSKLVDLVETGRVHPDALVLLSGNAESALERRGLALATQQDPFNAQLSFYRFCTIWKGNVRFQPEAAQLLRRVLQCAPGHGKSHMCLPHVIELTAENTPYILAHSQTGYQLLPGNAFALNNFCSYLQLLAPYDPRIPKLFLEATDIDPASPAGYRNAIEFLLARNRPAEALQFAEMLVRLCMPPLDERTVYCFRQNPSIAAEMDDGRFDPAQYAQGYLDACLQRLASG